MYHKIEDKRVNCLSVMTEMAVGEYLTLVEKVYDKDGGIDGQRPKLKTKTALTIRNRLVDDIVDGAVIPPIVLGYLASTEEQGVFVKADTIAEVKAYLSNADDGKISIIDGMQRTTALKEAAQRTTAIKERSVRVEIWVATSVNSLIYRMLVLNTGQVPWDIGRQLETVYGQFIKQIQTELGGQIEIFKLEDKRRRSQASQYQGRSIVELLLIFSSRKIEVDIKEKISEEFARIDAIEASSNVIFLDQFVAALKMLSALDKAFSRLDVAGPPNQDSNRIKYGKDIFGSFPAMAGFCAAVSIHAFDEPGFPIPWDDVSKRMSAAEKSINVIIEKTSHFKSSEELYKFLQIQLLEEKLSQRSGQVGRFEREFFRKAFSVLFRNAERMTDMAPCWMAH